MVTRTRSIFTLYLHFLYFLFLQTHLCSVIVCACRWGNKLKSVGLNNFVLKCPHCDAIHIPSWKYCKIILKSHGVLVQGMP